MSPPPPQKKPAPQGKGAGKGGKAKKTKQPTQRPPMQRVKVLGADGKIRWEWRAWGS